jgi:putative peptide zinc metalloprotease protein
LLLGMIPRFGIQTHGIFSIGKAEQLWTHATPVLIRLGIFGLASWLWLMSRGSGTELSTFCLLLTVASLTSFILTINPLVKANGYLLLSAWLEIPGLREKANRALMSRFSGGNQPRGDEEENQFALQAYAVASMIFIIAAGILLVTITARWLEFSFQGAGVVLFLAALGYLIYYFRQNILAKRQRRSHRASVIQKRLEQRHGEAAAKQFERQVARVMMKKPINLRKMWSWKVGVVLLVLAVVAMLPYPYETGGEVVIMPIQRQEIFAEIDGTILDVFFSGGEAVTTGTVLAQQISAEEQSNLLTNEAAIREKQARLDKLLNSPTPEELQLAAQRLDTARTEAKFNRESVDRLRPLSESGDISIDDFDEARRKAEVSQMQVLEAEANLAKVEAGPNPQEIDAARFDLERLTEQRQYYQDRVDMSQLVMPFDGRIVTRNLDFMRGDYLDEGDLFAVVENDQTVIVEVEVLESDIADVEVGARVKVKVWSFPGETFVGTVKEISPTVEEEDRLYQVVVVTTEVPNPDGMLRSGMTGFAKVESGTKPVIVAFTRIFVRFFLIKIWSWLP